MTLSCLVTPRLTASGRLSTQSESLILKTCLGPGTVPVSVGFTESA
jgi:hypothetical protein